MDNPFYVTLSRQVGLDRAMRVVANNIANVSTEGYRREGAVFVEWVDRLAVDGGGLAQTSALVRVTDFSQGALRTTNGDFDLAIEGDGFFMVQTDDGAALTRAGSFTRSATGVLVAQDGARLLGQGGAPVSIPAGVEKVSISTDGVVSANGRIFSQIGLFEVADRSNLSRSAMNRFPVGEAALFPAQNTTVFQGFVEKSNVNPVREITRMIEIQRGYEAGQSLMEAEHERLRQATRVLSGA